MFCVIDVMFHWVSQPVFLSIHGYIICVSPSIAVHQWLIPVILATQEVEIWRIMVWGQLGQKVYETQTELITGHGDTHLSSLLLQETVVHTGLGKKWNRTQK
jgi:hypothetical protein